MDEKQYRALTAHQLRARVANSALKLLTADGVENTEAGMCAGYAREAMEDATDKRISHPRGLDAQAAYNWYKERGGAVNPETGTVPGYLLFKFAAPRMPHGHVGIRVPGNRVAENSTVHAQSDEDARGLRTLSAFGQIDGAIDPARVRR